MLSFISGGWKGFCSIQRWPHFSKIGSTHFMGLGSTIIRGIHISGSWIHSFQGVEIEEFHCIQRYHLGWNRGVPLYTEVSSFQGVGIEEFHCIQRYPHFKGVGIPYIEVSENCNKGD